MLDETLTEVENIMNDMSVFAQEHPIATTIIVIGGLLILIQILKKAFGVKEVHHIYHYKKER